MLLLLNLWVRSYILVAVNRQIRLYKKKLKGEKRWSKKKSEIGHQNSGEEGWGEEEEKGNEVERDWVDPKRWSVLIRWANEGQSHQVCNTRSVCSCYCHRLPSSPCKLPLEGWPSERPCLKSTFVSDSSLGCGVGRWRRGVEEKSRRAWEGFVAKWGTSVPRWTERLELVWLKA